MTKPPKTKAARIKAVRQSHGKTQQEFADALGTSRGAVGNWEVGKGITTDNLALISSTFGVPLDWLVQGVGPGVAGAQEHIDSEDILADAPRSDKGSEDGISTVRPYRPKIPNGQPVVSSALSAGGGSHPQTTAITEGGIVYAADAILGEIVLPPSVAASVSNAPTSRIHWFEVRGDSMEPTLMGGDWVGVNTTDVAIGQGGVFALRDDNGEILVKRLRRLRGADIAKVEIISDNTRQGVDTELLENIVVFGRIVARISRVG